MLTYRDFKIEYDPPPIPIRSCDWQYWHTEYDGPGDHRIGHAPTCEAAKAEIDRWYEEQE